MGIFSMDHAQKLLHNKFIILIGDSVQRSIYKDLVVLLQENRFMKKEELRAKGEKSFLGDVLVFRSELTNGINYKEVREYKTDHVLIRFYFATRIYNNYIENILKEYEKSNQPTPDVVLLNSCLWDITRYGKNGVEMYQKNIEKFCSRLDEIVPVETCIIWRTTLPVSQAARGGFLVSDVAKKSSTLLVDVLLANHLAHAIVTKHKYDVIDMHYLFTQQQQRRAADGVHWNMLAHRRMTNIVLTHVSQAWGLGAPVHPRFDESNIGFDSADISMNTTDVLEHAYPSTSSNIPRMLTTQEERYGGPIRHTNEMYNYYNNFYNIPVPPHEDTQRNQENAFQFDLQSIQPHVKVMQHGDNHWAYDQPLSSCHNLTSQNLPIMSKDEYYLQNGFPRPGVPLPSRNIRFDLHLPNLNAARSMYNNHNYTNADNFVGQRNHFIDTGRRGRKRRKYKPYSHRPYEQGCV